MTPAHLVILYGVGGLSDVGRHAVAAALERDDAATITVLTKHPELLDEPNWNCGCPDGHKPLTEKEKERVKVVPLKEYSEMEPHFQGATAVVSCLGNRQPFFGHTDAFEGTSEVLRSMKAHKVDRLVCMSSTGCNDDWPAMDSHWTRWIMSPMLMTCARTAFKDLCKMEDVVRASDSDYLLIRPVGIPEDEVPVNKWYIQKKKWEDAPHFIMAKLDVARYMVEEALKPTRHKDAVVIGGEPRA